MFDPGFYDPSKAAIVDPAGGRALLQPSSSAEEINWLKGLTANETFIAAKLTAAERKQIIDQVEKFSFNVPDSWES